MNRREFLKATGIAGGAVVLSCARGQAAAGPARPNLLVIHTDQQSCWTLSAYGPKLIDTPHIDSLAADGAIFNNFFTNSAVCTPSRGCFLTGRYPHAHGAYRNNIPLKRNEKTFARVLLDAGYDTGYAGKWHLDGTPKPGFVKPDRAMGFADSTYMFNRGHWKKITEPAGQPHPKCWPYKVMGDRKTYTTDWLADKTIAFISRPRKKPFCFMVSIPDPHGPYRARPPYGKMYKPEDMPVPETFNQKDLPKWARGRGKGRRSEAALRKAKAEYCGAVKLIDDSVGRILKCLDDKGILDNTIVVFTTDHGDYMGEHGLMGKNQLYETAYRIPLLIRWPRKIKKGTKIDNIVATVDFAPTILNLMGVKPSGREQGRDGSGLLRGKKVDWVDEAHIHHSSLERVGIFTPDYELAYLKEGGHILFDRRNDPMQKKNLFGEKKYRKVIDELTARIAKHHIEVKSPAVDWLRKA